MRVRSPGARGLLETAAGVRIFKCIAKHSGLRDVPTSQVESHSPDPCAHNANLISEVGHRGDQVLQCQEVSFDHLHDHFDD